MNRRRDTDMGKLMNAGYTVEPINESIHRFHVYINGPADSLYSGGVWKVYVELTENYPNQSPSLLFVTPIYHPNIQLPTGAICVNLLDGDWNSRYDLVTVFDLILPTLLMEPNPLDAFNTEAAELLKRDKSAYEKKVKGVWKVVVHLTETYPYESPLVHFVTPIYHPNIHLQRGGICVNLLDDQWDYDYDLVTVFDMTLPQLLMEPNASDPLNKEAAKLLQENKLAYEEKVKGGCTFCIEKSTVTDVQSKDSR